MIQLKRLAIVFGAALFLPMAARAGEGAVAVAKLEAAKGAATQPVNKSVSGTVTFTQTGDGVKMVADLMGLSPGKHGIHIHEKTDFSAPDLTSAGGHWDPEATKQHGGPESAAGAACRRPRKHRGGRVGQSAPRGDL